MLNSKQAIYTANSKQSESVISSW